MNDSCKFEPWSNYVRRSLSFLVLSEKIDGLEVVTVSEEGIVGILVNPVSKVELEERIRSEVIFMLKTPFVARGALSVEREEPVE